MDYLSNKALMIAVGIIVTLSITSGIMITIGQLKNIYKSVEERDISIKNNFNEFDMYAGTQFTGLGVLNTAKKYLGNDLVSVVVNESTGKIKIDTQDQIDRISKSLEENKKPYLYDSKFKASFFEDNIGRTTIEFSIL